MRSRVLVVAAAGSQGGARSRDPHDDSVEVFELSSLVFTQARVQSSDLDAAFSDIASRLDSGKPGDLRNLWLLLDFPADPGASWDPLLSYDSSRSSLLPREILVAWLALAYPEVRVLARRAACSEPPSDSAIDWDQHLIPLTLDPRELLDLRRGHAYTSPRSGAVAAGGDNGQDVEGKPCHAVPWTWHTPALFDPSGLRNWLKTELSRRVRGTDAPPPANRSELAAVIDEESGFAYFNALAAYRFGYRVASVMTALGLREVFKEENPQEWRLTLEDVYLHFCDREEVFPGKAVHLSDFSERDRLCPGLRQAESRILVTVGHARSNEARRRWKKSQRYLVAKGKMRLVFKPIAGVFRLWREARQWSRLANRPAVAKGFRWPPDDGRRREADPQASHSAPGRLLRIAEMLLARARRLIDSPASVEDAVQAAVLAMEAKEILGGMTPTTSLEALALQHEAEVIAESMFLGVEFNIDLKDRFAELQREVKNVSGWFNSRRQRRVEFNARLMIKERLARRFSDLNQIEEELTCLAAARRLRFGLFIREKPYRWIFWPALEYVAFALSSLGRFAFGVATWILLFAGIHRLLHITPEAAGNSFGHALASTAYFFMTLQPCAAVAHSSLVDAVLAIQGAVAFLNLGLLISHLYLVISRR